MTEETTVPSAVKKPRVNSKGQKELDRIDDHFDTLQQDIKSMNLDDMKNAPILEAEPQTKLSSKELNNSAEVYLKPERMIGDRQKFNEKFQKDWEFDKEYVRFIAEHKEIVGEDIEIWTHKYGGKGAEFWRVPTNKPVWGPRYLAEQIKNCQYHRFVMQNHTTNSDGMGTYFGAMAVDTVVKRLDAYPAEKRRSVFMNTSGF